MTSEIYDKVFENNRKWAADRIGANDAFFKDLAKGQSPEFLFIGCADSRVPATQLMGLEPGNVFVHRNIANLVPNTDVNAHAVIEYAVNHLHVDHIVVCGHYGCGGVQASMGNGDVGIINGWLHGVRDVFRMHLEELETISDEGERFKRLVELNVYEQCCNVLKSPAVQARWKATGGSAPTVHGWVYGLQEGRLKDLNFPWEEVMVELRKIYDLDIS